jgi:uncharacterized protein
MRRRATAQREPPHESLAAKGSTVPRDVHVCVFAKAPRPGHVKTRLAEAIGPEHAADLAAAFLADTWASLARLPWARPIAAVDAVSAPGLPATTRRSEIWLQGRGDLGARIERVLRRALRELPFAIALGADTPGLPRRLLERARAELHEADAVLGPARDGGFYLLGLRRCPPGLLRGLPWSRADTFEHTRDRLRERGLTVSLLPRWFDVDRPADLTRMRALLDAGEIRAANTARVLRRRRDASKDE